MVTSFLFKAMSFKTLKQCPVKCDRLTNFVMPGLDPDIHVEPLGLYRRRVDGRDRPGHDGMRETMPFIQTPNSIT